jgi:hypothetical protein
MARAVSCVLTFSHVGKIANELAPKAIAALDETAAAIEARAKASMAEPKHGKTRGSGDVTRNLRKGERKGLSYREEFGKIRLRTAGGLLVREPGARGKKLKVVIGAKLHRASAPGESPAVDTGNLTNSLHTIKRGKFTREVITNAEYAKALEFGAPSRKLAPRPFLKPAAEAEGPAFKARMAKVFG